MRQEPEATELSLPRVAEDAVKDAYFGSCSPKVCFLRHLHCSHLYG
jgi:hypothetical protein